MSDRELLEMAAKAAGLKLADEIDSFTPDGNMVYVTGKNGWAELWCPLTEDGDAFRLAAKLRMTVDFGARKEINMESTRRAIVQAAAEIGKSK